MSIIIISKLVADDAPDVFRIDQFQNKIRNEYIKLEYKESFQKRLKENKFNNQVKEIIEKIRKLRHKRIAHTTQEYYQEYFDDTASLRGDLTPLLSEIKVLCEKLNFCFDNLAFLGSGKLSMLPFEYRSDLSIGIRSDIEEILDSIARNSFILYLPESDLARWREIMDSRRGQIRQFNHYRKKFGMSEIYLN